jgi:predicted Ser/Thr protein kinase
VDEPRAATLALLDRLVVLRIGYALAIRDEVRNYEKFRAQTGIETENLSPLALPAADLRRPRTLSGGDGSFGLPPCYVMNELSRALAAR